MMTDYWLELHGDRLYADDPSIIGAILDGFKFFIIAQEKGRGTKDKVLGILECLNLRDIEKLRDS